MQGTKRRVLIVDDEEVIADSLAMILNQAGFETHAVYNGDSALEIVPGFKPDFLISDVIMPGISGIETAIWVRTMLPSCKIILFSGQEYTSNLLEMARSRGYEFEILNKPVHAAHLIACMQAVKDNVNISTSTGGRRDSDRPASTQMKI
jgi:DNA-binding NtrC family response regulator